MPLRDNGRTRCSLGRGVIRDVQGMAHGGIRSRFPTVSHQPTVLWAGSHDVLFPITACDDAIILLLRPFVKRFFKKKFQQFITIKRNLPAQLGTALYGRRDFFRFARKNFSHAIDNEAKMM